MNQRTQIMALLFSVFALSTFSVAEEDIQLKQTLDRLLPGIGSDDFETSREPQQEWQEICFSLGAPDKASQREEACRLMAEKLGSETPAPARIWMLKQLQAIGRQECVEAVAEVLDDPDPHIQDAARRALTSNPAREAGAELLRKLRASKEPSSKVQWINALGYRAEPESLMALQHELDSRDAPVIAAAAQALAKLGTPDAADAVGAAHAKANRDVRSQLNDAYLKCADQLLDAGKSSLAIPIYQQLATSEPGVVRLAAYQGWLHAAGAEAPRMILWILKNDDIDAHQVAAGHVMQLVPSAVKTVADGLSALPPRGQVALLRALGPRRDIAALPAVLAAAKSEDDAVKMAALEALRGVADASAVPLLVSIIRSGSAEATMARQSLDKAFGQGIDQKLIAMLSAAQELDERNLLIETLDRRRTTAAVSAFLEQAVHDDDAVRGKAMGALSRLAEREHVAGMIEGFWKAADEEERVAAEKFILSVCRRIEDSQDHAAPVLAAYADATPTQKSQLLRLLGRIGGDDALTLIRSELESGDAARYDHGLRAISNWPDGTVAEDLLKISANAQGEGQRSRAVRALARVLVLGSDRSDEEKLELLKQAMKLASRSEDRELILERAAAIRHIETIRFVRQFLEDKDIQERACRTVVDLAHHRGLREPHQAEFDEVLQSVIRVAKDKDLSKRAERYMSKS